MWDEALLDLWSGRVMGEDVFGMPPPKRINYHETKNLMRLGAKNLFSLMIW
jgi:hypothetical protein